MASSSKEGAFQGKRLHSDTRKVVLNVYHYFDAQSKKSRYGMNIKERTAIATGEYTACIAIYTITFRYAIQGLSESTIHRIVNEGKSPKGITTPRKRYQHSRIRINVDDFDRDAIRREIYALYDKKENLHLSKILVRVYSCTLLFDYCSQCMF